MTARKQSVGGGASLAAVLAGGRARRMGASKATVRLCGRMLIEYPLRAAHAAGLETVVVAKRASELPELRERVLYEPDAPSHPLCGVLTALREGRALLALGCDMPFLTPDLLAWLAETGEPALAQVGGRLQPLPALYRPQDAPALERALTAGGSLRDALRQLGARVIEEQELAAFGEPRQLLFSVNDARDLETATRWLAG